MKILHVASLYSHDAAYGGPITVAFQQTTLLSKEGHDVTLAMGWDTVAAVPDLSDVDVRLFPARPLFDRLRFTSLFSPTLLVWVIRNAAKYDVVHVHSGRDLIAIPTIWAASMIRGRAVVAQPHGMIVPQKNFCRRIFDTIITRPTLEQSRIMIALNDEEARKLSSLTQGRPIQVLSNSISLDSETFTSQHAEVSNPEILFVGRLHDRKRVMLLAEAMLILKNQGTTATASIIGPDSGDLARLSHFIEEHNLSNEVKYEGALSYKDVATRMCQSNIFAFPSAAEPWGMSLLEAIAANLPTVTTQGAYLGKLLANAGGTVITEETAHDFAIGLEKLIMSPQLRGSVAKNAASYAKEHFGSEPMIRTLTETYQQLISRPKNNSLVCNFFIESWAKGSAIHFRVLRQFNRRMPKSVRLAIRTVPDFDDSSEVMSWAASRRGIPVVILASDMPSEMTRRRFPPSTRFRHVHSPTGIYSYLRSALVAYSHGLYGSLSPTENQTVVNIWHGMPIKKIGLHANDPLIPRFDFTVATSQYYSGIMASAFDVPESSVFCCGLPRNDILTETSIDTENVILLLPTWRPSAVTSNELEQETLDVIDLNNALTEMQAKIIVKVHPYDEPDRYNHWELSNIAVLTDDDLIEQGQTLYKLLSKSKLLVTDYSSVAIDYLITRRPIIFLHHDEVEYREQRGFLVDPSLLADLGMTVQNIPDLSIAIRVALKQFGRATEAAAVQFNELHLHSSDSVLSRLIDTQKTKTLARAEHRSTMSTWHRAISGPRSTDQPRRKEGSRVSKTEPRHFFRDLL